jgi:hypothetical protein
LYILVAFFLTLPLTTVEAINDFSVPLDTPETVKSPFKDNDPNVMSKMPSLVTSIRRFWFDDFNKVESIFVTNTDAKFFIENKIRKLNVIKILFI